MNLFEMMNTVVFGTLPTLDGIEDWAVNEGGNAVAIVLVIFAVFYLVRQSWGKLIGFMIIAALVFFAVGNPDGMLENIEGIWRNVTGG
ncbi:TcpD family membrane protein [Halobacillus sp. Marseille-Q1614]|uniref:TcpD family membrane protein n=1 Tax=Halobacillus sp. Marseille-Q1614 TaxID=2709134 RepID=UPI0015711A82|nr:TcpD family membrane protein [Halobacillus sp. Marseille-Q1614]